MGQQKQQAHSLARLKTPTDMATLMHWITTLNLNASLNSKQAAIKDLRNIPDVSDKAENDPVCRLGTA